MDARTPQPRRPPLPRRLAVALCAPVVAFGCSTPVHHHPGYDSLGPRTPLVAPAEPPQTAPTNTGTLQLVDSQAPPVISIKAFAKPQAAEGPRVVPITLDVVLRLSEQHNVRIALARERLHESQLTFAQGARGWLPNTYAGVAYYRHEGGIQDFSGRLLHSSTGAVSPGLQIQSELDLREGVFQIIELERRVWQNKAEFSQVNNEVLLEAALTYLDLLTARRGEAIAADLAKYELKLLERTEKLAKLERGAAGLVEAVKATLSNRNQLSAGLRQKGNAASAKLVYLLGLPPSTCLQPVDLVLAPVELVDSSPDVCDLVARALAGGPGIHELEGLIAIVQLAMDKTIGAHNLLPAVQLNVYEGPFGAGPGASLAWDNRLDVGLQVRWNLTQLCQTEFKRNLIRSKQAQAMLNYEDLRGKLAAGVAEAKDAILLGREQIGLSAAQIRHASESYRLADERLELAAQKASEGDVLLAIRGLEQAHYNYLQAISGHNKAQVRLMMLLGCGPPLAGSPPQAPPELLPPPKAEEKREAARQGEWRPAREEERTIPVIRLGKPVSPQ